MIDVIEYYKEYLKNNFDARELDEYEYPRRIDACRHILYMISRIEEFLNENRLDKANRWLGFIQGCLWSFGDFVLKDLKDHNREKELEPVVVNGRTYPKKIMEAVKKTYYTLNGFRHNIEDINYGHNLYPIALYPNKFKIVRGMDEVDDDGIYYVNENIEDELIEPFTNWINDIYKNKYLMPVGRQRASIPVSEFYKKYDNNNILNFQSLNINRRDMCEAKADYYYTNDLNPIRFFRTNPGLDITLWGQVVRCQNLYTECELRLFENKNISDIVVLMNLLNNLLIINPEFSIVGSNDVYIKEYLYKLKCLRHIYEGELMDHYLHIKMIRSDWIKIDINNLYAIKHDLELLKGLVMK